MRRTREASTGSRFPGQKAPIRQRWPRALLHDEHFRLICGRCDDHVALADHTVHLAAHSDILSEIDSRLDRESNAGNQQPFLTSLEIVDVRTGAVKVARIDRMTGPMNELIAIPARLDHVARCVVNLTTAHRLPCPDTLAKQCNRCVARIAHREPHAHVALRRLAKRTHPRLIGEDPVVFASPEVDENYGTTLQTGTAFALRLAMRLRSIRPYRDDGPMIRTELVRCKLTENPLLKLVFR